MNESSESHKETTDRKKEVFKPKSKNLNWILERDDDVWDREAGTLFSRDESKTLFKLWISSVYKLVFMKAEFVLKM